MVDDLIDRLQNIDGVQKVHVQKTVTVTHRKVNTGEVDETFQDIRERVVSEDEFGSVADELGWNHLGTIDVVGDYHLKDQFTTRETFENDKDTW